MTERHKWVDKHRTYGSWRCRCDRCGMVKDARFDRGHHWTEYQMPNGEWFSSDKTPACKNKEPCCD